MCDRKQSICVVDLRAVIKHRKPSSFYFLYSCIADSQITLDWNWIGVYAFLFLGGILKRIVQILVQSRVVSDLTKMQALQHLVCIYLHLAYSLLS